LPDGLTVTVSDKGPTTLNGTGSKSSPGVSILLPLKDPKSKTPGGPCGPSGVLDFGPIGPSAPSGPSGPVSFYWTLWSRWTWWAL